MEIPKHVKDSVKNSVGYSEATNKEAFLIGASVAFSRSEEFYESTIKSLTSQLENWKSSCESVTDDIKTLVGVIDKYNYLTE